MSTLAVKGDNSQLVSIDAVANNTKHIQSLVTCLYFTLNMLLYGNHILFVKNTVCHCIHHSIFRWNSTKGYGVTPYKRYLPSYDQEVTVKENYIQRALYTFMNQGQPLSVFVTQPFTCRHVQCVIYYSFINWADQWSRLLFKDCRFRLFFYILPRHLKSHPSVVSVNLQN